MFAEFFQICHTSLTTNILLTLPCSLATQIVIITAVKRLIFLIALIARLIILIAR